MSFGPFTLPDDISYITLDFDVTASRDGQDVSYSAEITLDGGETWQFWTRGKFAGGTPKRLDGLPIDPVLVSRDTVLVPGFGIPNRRVRGVLTYTGAARFVECGLSGS